MRLVLKRPEKPFRGCRIATLTNIRGTLFFARTTAVHRALDSEIVVRIHGGEHLAGWRSW